MSEETSSFEEKDQRNEPRAEAKKYYSAEIYIPELMKRYQFKLRDISKNGFSILVRQDSLILKHLEIGQTLEMTYHPLKGAQISETLRSRIQHISKCESGKFQGHSFVGFRILGKKSDYSS